VSEERLPFEEARERLRARGYLGSGLEGAVLKGALAARTRVLALVRAAAVAAVLLAAALAAGETAVLAAASGLPPRDAAVLFLWLLLGASGAAALIVLVLFAAAWIRARSRHAELMSAELGVVFGLVAGIAGAAAALPALESAPPLAAAVVLAAVSVVVFVSIRVARGVAFSVLLASGRAFLTRGRAAAGGGRAALVLAVLSAAALSALALMRRPPAADEPLVTVANARRVVLVGVDGWSDAFAKERAELPAVARLRYVKEGPRDPAAFWTTVATGEPAKKHGIGSLDLVRVVGVHAPVVPAGGSRWYLSRVLPALRLARRESVTAAARRVPAVWEVARRAGIPSLVVDWWTTYPADSAGGTVLSNHLFFAARAGHSLAGEGWPAEAAERAAHLAPRWAPEPGSVERLVEDARGLDAFSVKAFLDAREREKPRLMLLYLPGLDILAGALEEPGRSAEERVALAAALTEEASVVARLLADGSLTAGADLWAVLLDGGRRATDGALLLGGPLAREGASTLRPVDVAPTLLAALGVPASLEAAGSVRADLLAPGTAPSATVASWGRRRATAAPPIDANAYVDNLKSLGYLK
jgi:hypothetical protein